MIWQILDDEGKINESGVLGKIFQAAFGQNQMNGDGRIKKIGYETDE